MAIEDFTKLSDAEIYEKLNKLHQMENYYYETGRDQLSESIQILIEQYQEEIRLRIEAKDKEKHKQNLESGVEKDTIDFDFSC